MGRRGANQTALMFNALGVLACGLSRNMEMLIAARFVGTFSSSENSVKSQGFMAYFIGFRSWLELEGAVCLPLAST